MAYNVIDIIDKAITVDNKNKEFINNEAKRKSEDKVIQLMNKVMTDQLDISIRYYDGLKMKLQGKELSDIDFMTYDKISFLVNEFIMKIHFPKMDNVIDYIKFMYELSKERYSLFVDIQGRLVNNTGDTSSEIYIILTEIIDNINEQIKKIEEILNKKYTT
ncbi:MAG: hypothetical protein MJ191_01425 [Clostridium sp.]|nr:hypothetical protein [Clostridium sp.]